MKTYAPAVTKSCSSALAPRKNVTAVKKVTAKEERSRNIMIYGIEESQQENVLENVKTILSEIDEKPAITECRRVGTQKTGAIRPVKFAVSSVDHAIQVMRNAGSCAQRRDTDQCISVLIEAWRREGLTRSLWRR